MDTYSTSSVENLKITVSLSYVPKTGILESNSHENLYQDLDKLINFISVATSSICLDSQVYHKAVLLQVVIDSKIFTLSDIF